MPIADRQTVHQLIRNRNPMSDYGAIIAGTGSFVPEKRLTNDDLSKMVDTNDEWIVQRTGIKERRIAGPDESTATLGTAAARRAIEAAGLEPKDIDLIICGTITPEMVFPSHRLLRRARRWACRSTPAFDMSAACSGFIYTLDTGAAFIKSGQYKNVLVIGAETLSRITNYKDRGSCILFGDGAGAVVLQRVERPEARPDLQQPPRRRHRLGDALNASPAAASRSSEALIARRDSSS